MYTKIVVFAPMSLYEYSTNQHSFTDWVNYWGWEPSVVNMRAKNKILYYAKSKAIVECVLT